MDITFIESETKMLRHLSAAGVLAWASKTFGKQVVLATSLGAEDQVLTHLIDAEHLDMDAFMLDTGRHFEETYLLLEQTKARYAVDVRLLFPDYSKLEPILDANGPNFFRHNISNRKQCCGIRKLEPLKRALVGRKAWVTGLRREQGQTRGKTDVLEWDEANQLVKINPLWRWSEAEVWRFIRQNQIPYNALHDQGFPSIGCAPCTRAIKPGEDVRAGRWWWEQPEQKECGLHWVNGKPVRANQHNQTQSQLEEFPS